jgi:3-oxoacyl-[acyl-carrier-protein] synthase-3
MTYAAITGWGKCLPPSILTNDDLSTFLDTDDKWITTRTGMKESRISHVPISILGHVAASRALAAAGIDAKDLELIIFGTTTPDEICPNTSSHVQKLLGATKAASIDVNTACTSFLYSLSTATAMIQTGRFKNAIVIGGEVISPLVDWNNRNIAVLFGDGASAFLLEASNEKEGLLSDELGCYGDVRNILSVHGWGSLFVNQGYQLGYTEWEFEGKEIFRKAVNGMLGASEKVLQKSGFSSKDVDLVVPHQANLRIINALSERLNIPMEKVFINVHRYGNMSAATVPTAIVEALEEDRVQPGSTILTPAFGGGLTWCAHLIKWGERVKPIHVSDIELPPCNKTALELVEEMRAAKSKGICTDVKPMFHAN